MSLADRSLVIIGTHNPPKLGVGVYLDGLVPAVANALRPSGWSTHYWANPSAIEMAAPAVVEAAEQRAVPALERAATRFPYALGVLPRELRRAGASAVLFANDPILGVGLPPAAALIHDLNEFEIHHKYGLIRSAVRSRILRRALGNADEIIVSTEHVSDQIRRFAPDAVARTTVVTPGLRSERHVPSPCPPSEDPFLLVVGRVDPVGKNLHAALAVFDAMQAVQSDLRLVMVGGFNPSIKAAGEAFLASNAHRQDIEFLGHVSDDELGGLYDTAQATVLMSRHEGFGLPIAEAMTHGCPVIVSTRNPTANDITESACVSVDESRLGRDPSIGEEIWAEVRSTDRADLRRRASRFDWQVAGERYASIVERLIAGIP